MRAIALCAAAVISGTAASSQSWPTFELDLDASVIDVQTTGCVFSCAGLTAEFGQGAHDFSWTPQSADERIVVQDFFNWRTSAGPGYGAGPSIPAISSYRVHTDLVFASPDEQTASGSGNALVLRLWGDYSAGVMRWTEAASLVFDQGSVLDVAFESFSGFWSGSVSTAATFMGNLIQPSAGGGGPTASVPLPGSFVLLLGAIGILGGTRALKVRGRGRVAA